MSKKPLWTCPLCGHQFVTRNMWHSCNRYRIEDHFIGKDPFVRELFDHYLDIVRGLGPLTVYAQKTRIVFQVRARFAGAVIRKHWLEGGLWLKRRVDSPRFFRVEHIPPRDYVYYFKIHQLDDLDPELIQYLREAYSVGAQTYEPER